MQGAAYSNAMGMDIGPVFISGSDSVFSCSCALGTDFWLFSSAGMLLIRINALTHFTTLGSLILSRSYVRGEDQSLHEKEINAIPPWCNHYLALIRY
jgi:hypothetical protein